MSLLRRVVEKRSVEDPRYPLTSKTLVEWLERAGGGPTDSGQTVNATSAMRIAAVNRCVSLISGAVAALPFHTYKDGTRQKVPNTLLDSPHPDLTSFEFWELVMVNLLLKGNGYCEKIRNGNGEVVELWPMNPDAVDPVRARSTKANPSGKVFNVTAEDGTMYEWTPEKVFHIPGLGFDGIKGMSVIEAHKQGLGLALAAEKFGARFFGSGTVLSGILTSDKDLNDEKAESLKTRFKAKLTGPDKSHDIAVLGSGTKFQQLTINPTDAQFLETRKFQVNEIERMFGVPPHLDSNTDKESSWGTGIEQMGIGFVIYGLQRWYRRIEARATRELTPPGQFSEFKVEGLLRGDSKARSEFYTAMLQNKVMNPNEVRDLENMEPYTGGEKFLETPNNSAGAKSEDKAA